MQILISNDDGVYAPGLKALSNSLKSLGEQVVIAPDKDRSGASSSLTLDVPIRVLKMENGFYATTGTPSDCVHLALTGVFTNKFDIVVSGINSGPNLGDDVIYSGTVACALEGRFLGYPTVALSLASQYGEEPKHFSTAAIVARNIVSSLAQNNLPQNIILNINVPDLPFEDIKGIKVTRLGFRHKAERAVYHPNPKGQPMYWIGPPGKEQDAGEGTDFDAINNGYVSITPLVADLTDYKQLSKVNSWIATATLADTAI